jgi:hypothetical protein
MVFAVPPQQVRKETGSQRGEDANPNASLLGATNRCNVLCAATNLPKRLSRVTNELLTGLGQKHAPIVSLKQGRSQMIF